MKVFGRGEIERPLFLGEKLNPCLQDGCFDYTIFVEMLHTSVLDLLFFFWLSHQLQGVTLVNNVIIQREIMGVIHDLLQ